MPLVKVNIPSKTPLPNRWEEVRRDFPMPSPRPFQQEVLSVIYYAMAKDDFDNIVVQVPTGIGKSAIAMTLQNRFKSGYLLTPSLGLTEQYMADYGDKLVEVRGRRNFDCWVRPGTAHAAPCWRSGRSCPHTKEEDPCPYYEQKFAGRDARMTLSNPAYLFRVVQGNSSFEQRDFAIIDEAHQLEDFMLDLMEGRITAKEWRLVFGPRNFPHHCHAADWLDDVKEMKTNCEALIEKAELDGDEDKVQQFTDILSKVITCLELLADSKNCVVESNNNRFGTYVAFRPVRANRFAGEHLDNVARKRIFLSATVLDIDTFLGSLGLEDQKTLYVNVTKSPFPDGNFNVHYAGCGSMSWGKRAHSIPRQIKAITGIMEKWPNKRGVILPHSHAIRKEIVNGLKDAGFEDRIVTHDSDVRGREMAIKKFLTDPDDSLVLISTYVGEGFDFKGKLAEWLVMCKIPYLPIKGDAVIEQRMEEDEHQWRRDKEGTPECPYEPPTKYSNGLCGNFTCPSPCQKHYNLKTALKVVQGAGRIVRSPDDVGHLFILDGSWPRFFRQNSHLLPAWFRSNVTEPPTWLKRHLT